MHRIRLHFKTRPIFKYEIGLDEGSKKLPWVIVTLALLNFVIKGIQSLPFVPF